LKKTNPQRHNQTTRNTNFRIGPTRLRPRPHPEYEPHRQSYDNALAESFVATLKTECFGASIPPTRAAAELMAFDYIETFYNRRRRHSSLGQRSPLDFEKQMFAPNKTN